MINASNAFMYFQSIDLRKLATLTVFSGFILTHAQTPHQASGARDLYYFSDDSPSQLPPIRKDTAPLKPKQFAAMHLGLRYNILIQNPKSKVMEPVRADRIFKSGDCFSIDFEANRSGYLYVLAKQSSRVWRPLLPTSEMPEEGNRIDPGKKFRVPSGYCFEINNPPGTETLFVVLSRDPRDYYALYEGVKAKHMSDANSKQSQASVEMADSKVNSAVKEMADHFGSRDILIKKVPDAESKAEPLGSVYVVNSSDKPVSSIVTQIEVKHR